jgi:tRNA A-37 threonylcarbamoyl transferase component Bud32
MANTNYLNRPLNQTLVQGQPLLALAQRPDIVQLLKDFDYDWHTGSYKADSEIFRIFQSFGWLEDSSRLSRIGRLVYSRLALHFEKLDDEYFQVGNYKIKKRLGSGKNSVIFLGEHNVLGFEVVLKFIRPGASDDIDGSLRKLASKNFGRTLVMPNDVVRVEVHDVIGRAVDVTCLVFPFVQGQTLSDFLNEKGNHLNSHVVISFINQVGPELEKLESINAYHGDLHSQNILVDRTIGGLLEFRLLDLSFDAVGSESLQDAQNDDLRKFKQLIWQILSAQKRCIPNVSLRKFIGTKDLQKIETILSERVTSFHAVMQVFRDDTAYAKFLDDQKKFMEKRFAPPNSFRLQRYEEFTDPSVAAKLFVPFPELQEKINEFGNVYVSGNRGSGKSTYLASLAFFPTVDDPERKFTQTFGVYFPCRQGEFRALTPVRAEAFGQLDRKLLHIVAMKIVRRTLEALAEGVAHKKIDGSTDYSPLREFLNPFLPAPGIILVEGEILPEINNFVSTVARVELEQIKQITLIDDDALIGARDLIRFFNTVRAVFPELKSTRFHLLFDDAGEPYVQREVQRALNDVMINSNPVYCVKLSAEKNTYTFQTGQGKDLENGHDYYEHDISYSLFIGSGTAGIKRETLEEYFRQIVELRLNHFLYRSTDIRDYLGDQHQNEDRLLFFLASGRKDAYYFGWSTVWNIADRNPRNLLELVSEIFAVGGVERDSIPARVAMRDQSRAIKTISEKRLQSLSQIAGAFSLHGRKVSLGRQLFDVTTTVGSAFYTYLRQEIPEREKSRPVKRAFAGKRERAKVLRRIAATSGKRVRQHLALERNDLSELDPVADYVLQKLVTFGVFDDSKVAVSRDDQVKKPIYVLNRIYCPAFSIGYRRDEHLRLSRNRLQQLLLQPQAFLRDGTRKLRHVTLSQIELFGYSLRELSDG